MTDLTVAVASLACLFSQNSLQPEIYLSGNNRDWRILYWLPSDLVTFMRRLWQSQLSMRRWQV